MKIEAKSGFRTVLGAAAVTSLLWMPGLADPAFSEPVAPTQYVTVGYTCFVTFPTGSTFVPYSLTFGVTAPETVGPPRKFDVVFDPPVITPNPFFQTAVKDVAVVFRLPPHAKVKGYELSGGANLGPTPPTVDQVDDRLVLRAAGPFAAAVPFELPTLTVRLQADSHAGVVETSTGGTSHVDPSFSWTRIDTTGTERPFGCQPPTAVVFSRTIVAH